MYLRTLDMNIASLSRAVVEKATRSCKIRLRIAGSCHGKRKSQQSFRDNRRSGGLLHTSICSSINRLHHSSNCVSNVAFCWCWGPSATEPKRVVEGCHTSTSDSGVRPDFHRTYPFRAASMTVKWASARSTGTELLL